jgi:ribosomal protein S24E
MREILIIKTDNSEKLKNFLDREKVNYEVYHEGGQPRENLRNQLIAAYKREAQNPVLQKELTM